MSNPNHDNLGRFSSGAQALGKIAAEPGATFTEAEFAHVHGRHHFAALKAMEASGHIAKVEAFGQHVHQGNSGLYVRSLKPLPTIEERVAANNAAMRNAKAISIAKKQGHAGQAGVKTWTPEEQKSRHASAMKAIDDIHAKEKAKLDAIKPDRAAKQKAFVKSRQATIKKYGID